MPLPGSMNNTSTLEDAPKRAEANGAAAVFEVIALPGNMAATLLFGLIPALLTSKIDLASALRSSSGALAGTRGAWVRSSLVLVQVSLSFVLLVGAGLLMRSMLAVRDAVPGFAADRVLTTTIDLFTSGYEESRARVFQDQLLDRVRAIPGVESAALSRMTPFSYRSYSSAPVVIDGYNPAPDQRLTIEYNEVGPEFLATMGIRLISGRDFTRADDDRALNVSIVDETMAAQFWPNRDPVGQRLQVNGRWLHIVGVASAAKYHTLQEPRLPFFYVPLRQHFTPAAALQIRTTQRPPTIEPALVREIQALDANVAPSAVITMGNVIGPKFGPPAADITTW